MVNNKPVFGVYEKALRLRSLEKLFDTAASCGYETFEPVSYTHLDVYKRQAQCFQAFQVTMYFSVPIKRIVIVRGQITKWHVASKHVVYGD